MKNELINSRMNLEQMTEVFNKIFRNLYILRKCSERFHYFWSALFATIFYRQTSKTVQRLNADTGFSEPQIYGWLQCKRKLHFDDFYELCEALNTDICNPDFTALEYAFTAIDYIVEINNYNPRLSAKGNNNKEKRKAFFQESAYTHSDEYLYDLVVKQNACIEEELLNYLKNFSDEHLSYLYQIADILSYLFTCDITFLQLYLNLNSSGKTIFKDALALNSSNYLFFEDTSIEAFKNYSTLAKKTKTNSISPSLIIDKLGKDGWYSLENAQILALFLDMEEDTWDTLILFHKFAAVSDEKNLPDLPYNIILSLLTFLDWLNKLPTMTSR